MGRKSKKIKHKVNDVVDYDIDDTYIDYKQIEDDLIYKKISTLTDLQTDMIKYVDKMCLPLCDHLTTKKLESFIADKLCY